MRTVRPDDEYFRVVVNREGYHAIWPLDGPPPRGWAAIGFHGSRAGCLAYVAELTPGGPRPPAASGPAAEPGVARTLGEVWAHSVASHPDVVAVSHGASRITYRELDELSDALAAVLVDAGARPEDRVLMWVHPGIDMVVALLGGVKSGAAYVPLDARAGGGRWRAAALDDSGANLVVAGSDPPPGRAEPVAEVGRLTVLARGPSRDPARPSDTNRTGERPAKPVAAGNVVTVSYAPRGYSPYALVTAAGGWSAAGVVLEHRHLLFPLQGTDLPPIGPGDRALQRVSPSSDLIGMEVWYPLTRGAQLVIDPAPATDRPGPLWTPRIRRADGTWPRPVWLLGHGETASAFAVAEPGHPTVLRPLSGYRLHVLDRQLRPTAAGEVGDLYVAGPGLARGYLGRPDLTLDRFLPDPFEGDGLRMYAVGATAIPRATGAVDLSSLHVTTN